ncbi:50S ribosomal protein L35ae [Candidatus Woesearchaeota archaeon]|nr:50S ribosomal protein L35ae [Candidatus Woesearchaeota archaeon]
MKAKIANFRRGRHVQKTNQMVLYADQVNNKESAQKLVGKAVVFKTQTGREIKGKVTNIHGNKGAVRALFEKGMPGQAIGRDVEIQ